MKARFYIQRGLSLAVLTSLLLVGVAPREAEAQQRPPERMIRTYIPPDQLVSFLPSTPFNQFVDFLNPIFERVTGKSIVDPLSTTGPIGIAVAGMHFLDAFELVLEYNDLMHRETDKFFIVEEAVDPSLLIEAGGGAPVRASSARGERAESPATLRTREIKINAVLFDLNHTRARQIGLDWNVFFGESTSSSSGGGAGGAGGAGGRGGASDTQPRFFLKTGEIFESVDDHILAPDLIEFSTLTQFFRLLETEGVGETVANPTVTVQSGQEGRIQIGSDVPVNVRDFAGNTVTQFVSTGIIIRVTPTMITEALVDTLGSATMDFIHMNVHVEKSNSRASAAGPTIDRNTATTQVVLLDGEQTVIGGLYSSEEAKERRGIPLLKDLPGWFFGLRYIFGNTLTTVNQKELLIVLQAEIVDPIQARANRPHQREVLEDSRSRVKENIRRVDEGLGDDVEFPASSKGAK